jgi:hypothetical protein
MFALHPSWVLGVVLVLLLGAAGTLWASDLKVWSWPRTDKTYERIDVESVHPDSLPPFPNWQDQVRLKNETLAGDLAVLPVATIEVTRRDFDDDQIWIQSEGWIGRITDRSFQVKEVQAVGLLN